MDARSLEQDRGQERSLQVAHNSLYDGIHASAWQEGCEFVSAQPREQISLSHAAAKPTGNLLEKLIADPMSIPIIHFLKPVQIDEDDSKALVISDCIVENFFDSFLKMKTIGKARQEIVISLMVEFFVRSTCFDGNRCKPPRN